MTTLTMGETMTTFQKTNANLPEDEATRLREARSRSMTEFYAGVIALRNNNWPLRAIGEVFNVSRVAAKAWHGRALQDNKAVELATTYDAPQLPLAARGSGVRPVKLQPTVALDDQERIKKLAKVASQVRRYTPQDDPARLAARELEDLVYEYVNDKRVSPSVIARYAGVSRRAIVQRFEKAKRARA